MGYDVVLLDVDNGPEGLTKRGNSQLYHRKGLAAIRSALREGGVLAVWSSAPNEAFDRRIRLCGFDVDRRWVRARRTKGPRRTIWLATAVAAS